VDPGVFAPSFPKISRSQGEFGPPDNDYLVAIDIHFIFNIIQLKVIELAASPVFPFFLESFVFQKLIQNVPDFFKSEIIVGNDIKKKILMVKRVNLHIFHPIKTQVLV
jgi:hypothetical protein